MASVQSYKGLEAKVAVVNVYSLTQLVIDIQRNLCTIVVCAEVSAGYEEKPGRKCCNLNMACAPTMISILYSIQSLNLKSKQHDVK